MKIISNSYRSMIPATERTIKQRNKHRNNSVCVSTRFNRTLISETGKDVKLFLRSYGHFCTSLWLGKWCKIRKDLTGEIKNLRKIKLCHKFQHNLNQEIRA